MKRQRAWCGCAVVLAIQLACARTCPVTPSAPDARIVEFSILEDYDKDEPLEEVAKDFDLFKQLGVTTWRGSFGWDDYEPTRGVYDFQWLHRFAELAASRGITLRPYIGYTPAWAAAGGSDRDDWNDPPKNLDDWYRFVRTLASEMRRHHNIVSYEIYNEENVRQWWDGSADSYRSVLRRGAEAVEAGNPAAQVVLGGMVYPDLEWIEAVCDSGTGRRFDIIPFHAYPETWTPAGVTVENYLGQRFASDFVRPTDAACGPKPIWINETGYATTEGRTELDQARWWARAVATFLAEPRVEQIGIYEIKDLRPDREAIGDAPNYHLGITRVDRTRKLAFGTLTRLVALFGSHPIEANRTRVRISASPPGAEVHHQFFTRGDGRQLLFLWTSGDSAIVSVQLPEDRSRVTEYAIDGSETRQFIAEGGILPQLTLEPASLRFFLIDRNRSE